MLYLGSHNVEIKVFAKLSSCAEALGKKKSIAKFIQVVGGIQFLVVVGVRSLFPCWCQQGLHTTSRSYQVPSYMAPLILRPVKAPVILLVTGVSLAFFCQSSLLLRAHVIRSVILTPPPPHRQIVSPLGSTVLYNIIYPQG